MSDDRTEWRFLVKARPAEGGTVTLDEDQSHRLAEVLRIGEGRTVRIFTGDGEEFEAEVLDADRQGSKEHLCEAILGARVQAVGPAQERPEREDEDGPR